MSGRASVLAGVAAIFLWPSNAWQANAAVGDARAGHALSLTWCTSCHVVEGSGRGTDVAPAFATIAHRNPADDAWLRAWLAAPHPPMPNLSLSRQQIDDISAYLDSLRTRDDAGGRGM